MIPEILERHAEEVAFLWRLRDAAAVAPHHDRASLAALDERIDAHLDGLRIAGDQGFETAAGPLDPDEPGSVFAVATIAAERADEEGMGAALALAEASVSAARAITSALAWAPFDAARPVIERLLSASAPAAQRRIGIAASAAHRKDPGEPLAWAVHDDDPRLRARALRAAGELARRDLLGVARDAMRSDHEETRFWAAWSWALLGDGAAVPALWSIARAGGPFAERAVAVAARKGDPLDARARIEDLGMAPATARAAIVGAEALGDPVMVPWLFERMSAPALARAAAEAFATITAAVVERELRGEKPEGFEPGPNDDPRDANVAMDRDRNLPWPAPDALRAWWSARERGFRRGVRYLLGAPISPEVAENALYTASQKRRASAAIEVALLRPGQPLPEVRGRARA